MKVRIFGTAAAEGWPAVWCRCEHCRRARAKGGKDIRTRSGGLIDGIYKIDFGPDTYMQALRDGVDLSQVEHLLFTHSHEDHLNPSELGLRGSWFGHGLEHELQVWAGDKPLGMIKPVLKEYGIEQVVLRRIRAFEPFQAGDATVTPLVADHDPLEGCFIFAFERGGRRLLWGHDTGYLPDETWEYLTGRPPFDAVLLDCTAGPLTVRQGHMGIDAILEVKEETLRRGISTVRTRLIATHFSHNGGLLHAELEERLAPHGIEVAFDGMQFEI